MDQQGKAQRAAHSGTQAQADAAQAQADAAQGQPAQPGPRAHAQDARVVAVSLHERHQLSKWPVPTIRLIKGVGVEHDAHAGITVQHRSRVKADPSQPNLRQVHLIHAELLDALRAQGFRADPGMLGENVTTRGVDLLSLPRGTRLRLGRQAVVELTGLRNPCWQLDQFQPGLMAAVLDRDANGQLIRKCGVMAIVVKAGEVSEQDVISVTMPRGVPVPLTPV